MLGSGFGAGGNPFAVCIPLAKHETSRNLDTAEFARETTVYSSLPVSPILPLVSINWKALFLRGPLTIQTSHANSTCQILWLSHQAPMSTKLCAHWTLQKQALGEIHSGVTAGKFRRDMGGLGHLQRAHIPWSYELISPALLLYILPFQPDKCSKIGD